MHEVGLTVPEAVDGEAYIQRMFRRRDIGTLRGDMVGDDGREIRAGDSAAGQFLSDSYSNRGEVCASRRWARAIPAAHALLRR